MKMLSFQFRVAIVLVCACVFPKVPLPPRLCQLSRNAGMFSAALARGLPGFSNPDDKATGLAWMSTFAARWPPPFSAIVKR